VGVPTFHLESAQDQFERSIRVLKSIDEGFVCPEEMLLSLDKLRAYLDSLQPDTLIPMPPGHYPRSVAVSGRSLDAVQSLLS
jgi:hypothetical protein